jgi:hypothetical protein
LRGNDGSLKIGQKKIYVGFPGFQDRTARDTTIDTSAASRHFPGFLVPHLDEVVLVSLKTLGLLFNKNLGLLR